MRIRRLISFASIAAVACLIGASAPALADDAVPKKRTADRQELRDAQADRPVSRADRRELRDDRRDVRRERRDVRRAAERFGADDPRTRRQVRELRGERREVRRDLRQLRGDVRRRSEARDSRQGRKRTADNL